MKSVKLMCLSALAGFALLVMPLGLAAQQQQVNQHSQLTVTDKSESHYSTTTSIAPQNRIDDGPVWRASRTSTTPDDTVDYLKEYMLLEPQPFASQTSCLFRRRCCIPRYRYCSTSLECCPGLRCVAYGNRLRCD